MGSKVTFSKIYNWMLENPEVIAASRREEHEFWYDCVGLSPDTGCIFELGAYKCASTNTLAAACQADGRSRNLGTSLSSLDGCKADVPASDYKLKKRIHPELQDQVTFWISESLDFLKGMSEADHTAHLAFVLIDDDHGCPHVYHEFKLIRDMVLPGGIVSFHDTDFTGVRDSITKLEIDNCFEGWTEMDTPYAVGEALPDADVGFMYPATENYWSVRAWRKNDL